MNYQRERLASFNKLLAQESNFFSQEILAPVYNCPILVKIAGVLVELQVSPANFIGWGIFNTSDKKTATLIREASLIEKKKYLDLFPNISFMICRIERDVVFGYLLNDNRFVFKTEVPILLSDNIKLFDIVNGSFNGRHIFYAGHNRRISRAKSDRLIEALHNNTHPDIVEKYTDLSPGELFAYIIAYKNKLKDLMSEDEYRIRDAITRAGGDYVSFTKRNNNFMVTYEVDGQSYTSTIGNDLKVQTAGICLSGGDRNFDLQSLIGVVREGQERRRIVRY